MTLKQVVKSLNEENVDNSFKLSELAAKRDGSRDGYCVVEFTNSTNWCDFTSCLVTLYECIPAGWPLSDVARRLGCSVDDLRIVARRVCGKWHAV